MDEKKYEITLDDGRVLTDLTLNGDNFISKTEITEDELRGNCSSITISDGETVEHHEHTELIQVIMVGDEYWISFHDLTEDEIKQARMRADIDYMAMMADIDLEEDD